MQYSNRMKKKRTKIGGRLAALEPLVFKLPASVGGSQLRQTVILAVRV